ncbi:MAG: hypothetical protein P9L99_14165 [Candidatus Lernaella stagnicola]|nr:hypothetical protein [Candidatus Lernaella stagnicola]
MTYGFAYFGAGWRVSPAGQIQRATSIVDKARRLLRPLWGPVWSDPERGDPPRPPKSVDAIDVIVGDRAFELLLPMVRRGEISGLDVQVLETTNRKRRHVKIFFLDEHKKPHVLSEFVRLL